MAQTRVGDLISGQSPIILGPDATVLAAADLMVSQHVAAVLVADSDGTLQGLVTERDALARVLAQRLDPATTRLSEVMTPGPDTVTPDTSPETALRLMDRRGYRHLPVLTDGQIAGIISVRDLFAFVTSQLEEAVQERDAFMFGPMGR